MRSRAMAKVPWKKFALAAMVGASAPAGALAQTAPPPAQQTQAYSDAELQAFAKARAEIQPLQLAEFAAANTAARRRTEAQIDAALARNGLTRDDYDSIATVAQADPSLSARIERFAEADGVPHGA